MQGSLRPAGRIGNRRSWHKQEAEGTRIGGLVLSTLSACATSRSSLSDDITHRYACVRCVELMYLPHVPPPAPSCSRFLQVDDRGNVQATGPASSSAGSAVQLVSDINAVACNPRPKSANWQVQFPSGWHDLPPQASSAIEAARLRGENVAIYEQCRSKKTRLVGHVSDGLRQHAAN